MCLLRPTFARLAPRLEPDVSEEVAREGVQHSYPAYRDALRSIWEDNPLPTLLRNPRHPVRVIVADQDETVLPGDVLDLPLAAGIDIIRVEGTHALPFLPGRGHQHSPANQLDRHLCRIGRGHPHPATILLNRAAHHRNVEDVDGVREVAP
jgi:hypothetical protein